MTNSAALISPFPYQICQYMVMGAGYKIRVNLYIDDGLKTINLMLVRNEGNHFSATYHIF